MHTISGYLSKPHQLYCPEDLRSCGNQANTQQMPVLVADTHMHLGMHRQCAPEADHEQLVQWLMRMPCRCVSLLCLQQDPLAAALHRADSQRTPYNPAGTGTTGASHSPRMSTSAASPFGRTGGSSSAAPAVSPLGGGSASGSMFDRLRRVGSSSGSIASGSSTPTAAAAGSGGQMQAQSGQQQSSRLSKVTGALKGGCMPACQ